MQGNSKVELKPQPGPQTDFLSSSADIVIFGGAAGGGKTYGILLEPLRHVLTNKEFSCVIFRRTMPNIRKPGSLWDTSIAVYGQMPEATPREHVAEWQFKGGGKVRFDQLEYDKTVLDWHGAQVPLIIFDELTEFTQFQFFYMMTRNRSTSGVKPYIRATCNPDSESWVAEFIKWWINQETGLPIPERCGKLRYFIRVGDNLIWGDSPEELAPELHGAPTHTPDGTKIDYMPKSVTFIPSSVYDNQELLKANPEYLANLMAQPTVERERLLGGNWKIRPIAGLLFKRIWCEVIEPEDVPPGLLVKRGWDLAGTPKTQQNDPDFTCGTKLGRAMDGSQMYYVLDHRWERDTPGKIQTMVHNTAKEDSNQVEVWLPQDPGQAGKYQTLDYVKFMDGFIVRYSTEQGDKQTRFKPFSSRAEHGFVKVVRGAWNERWFSQLEGFPELSHDDDVDSTSRAYNAFLDDHSGLLDFYTQAANAKMKERAALMAERKNIPTLENGGIKVRAPAGKSINTLYDRFGKMLFPDGNGDFVVDEKQWEILKRSGFTLSP